MTLALTIAFIIMAFCLPAMFCAGFYFGFNTAEDVFYNQSVSKDNIPGNELAEAIKKGPKHFVPKKRETDEERLQRITAENIENYGTGIPQKEVI